MSLTEQINQDLKTAMQEGQADRTAVLRLLKSSLGNERIKQGYDLSDEEVTAVLKREAKQRRDSIEAYQKGGREELAREEQAELEIIESYLPEQLGEAELEKLVDEVIAETGASGPQEMGTVIGLAVKRSGGAADGAAVARLARQKLT